jgi:hypothetical protein
MNDESQTTTQSDTLDADLAVATMLVDNRKETRPRKRKVSNKRYAKEIYDPVSGKTADIPSDRLTNDAPTKALVKRINDLSQVVLIQSTLMMHWREMVQAARESNIIPVPAIEKLAQAGASQRTIANLLGFSPEAFKTRKDLHDAWTRGRAELELVLGNKQIETALKGNPLMQIFLGKQILNQHDTPTTVIQNNVGTDGSSLRTKIREQRVKAKEEWAQAIEDMPPVDAQYTEVKDGTVEAP